MLLNWNIYQINLVSDLHRYSHCVCFSFFQNYEMFSEAVEADTVEQFLKIAWEPNLVASNILIPSLVHVHIPKGRPACFPLLRWRCLPYLSQCHATCQKKNQQHILTLSLYYKNIYLQSETRSLIYSFELLFWLSCLFPLMSSLVLTLKRH